HPQSVIHSMVSFIDGSTKAQISPPDMRLAIQYALFYPNRPLNTYLPALEWDKITQLTFKQIPIDKFPCFNLAIKAGKMGGTYPAALAAADEVAVGLFLSGRIGFLDIPKIIEYALIQHKTKSHNPSLDDILAADVEARKYAQEWSPE
ncbi:MAG: 1-deoxy-D-xylulose-5-phosphate reductoisomerase, partial [Dehalococcoidia bacterium]|nr:1-deoxy-D-xylulose-5-phosphate reductoisomerase [Dehalococcoidia bacterium]